LINEEVLKKVIDEANKYIYDFHCVEGLNDEIPEQLYHYLKEAGVPDDEITAYQQQIIFDIKLERIPLEFIPPPVIALMDKRTILKVMARSEYEKTYTDDTWNRLEMRLAAIYEDEEVKS
jgi:hypothetical protein